MVIDTDGSAFITKAEFDSLKNNFQAQIDNYNNSIDSKIDGAIAAYLSGVRVSGGLTLLYDITASYTFTNSMRASEQKADQGITSLQHERIAGFLGVAGATAAAEVWVQPPSQYLRIPVSVGLSQTESFKAGRELLSGSPTWQSSAGTKNEFVFIIDFTTSYSSKRIHPDLANSGKSYSRINKSIEDAGLDYANLSGASWSELIPKLLLKLINKSDSTKFFYGQGSSWGTYIGTGVPSTSSLSADIKRVNSIGSYSVYDNLHTGKLWAINMVDGTTTLSKWYETISILDTIEIQNFTYKDGSGSQSDPSAWDDTSSAGYTLVPDASFSQQQDGTKQTSTSTATSASTYHRFLASQIKIPDNTAWSSRHQLGTTTYEPTMRCFNEDCTLAYGPEQIISGSTLKFNRTGYYMSGGTIQTKTDNLVTTGDIKYTNLIWGSTVYNTNQVKLDSFSSVAGENVFLGGGIPLAQSPTESTGIKIKLDYEVKKLNGSALTAADGNMNIKLEISDKQFSNGTVASGAVSHDTFTTTVNNTSPSGHWDSAAFNMGIKAKLWLNAYVSDKQGYNVVIKNINVQ